MRTFKFNGVQINNFDNENIHVDIMYTGNYTSGSVEVRYTTDGDAVLTKTNLNDFNFRPDRTKKKVYVKVTADEEVVAAGNYGFDNPLYFKYNSTAVTNGVIVSYEGNDAGCGIAIKRNGQVLYAQDGLVAISKTKLDKFLAEGDVTIYVTALSNTYSFNIVSPKVTPEAIAATYETKSNASATYETKTNAATKYETKTNASATYETKTNAAETYETKVSAQETYERKVDAADTYLSKTDASSTYETKTDAATNYATKTDVATVKEIAVGKQTAYVFATKAEMDTYIASHAFDLHTGDNLYIKATDVPDYWWDGSQAQVLETTKPNLNIIWTGTQEQYDALTPTQKQGYQLFVIVEASDDENGE